jgi:hypothetical protein
VREAGPDTPGYQKTNMDIIIIIFIDICLSARAQNNIQLLCVNINKTIIENMKI